MSKYLRLRNGVYHFRRKVPANLIKVLGVHEIVKSTGTGDRKLANTKLRKFLVFTDCLFELGGMNSEMDLRNLESLARRYYFYKLDYWETSMSLKKDKSHWEHNIDIFIESAKQRLINGSTSDAEKELREYCETCSETLPEIPEEHSTLVRLIQRAEVAWGEVLKARHKADYEFEPSDGLFCKIRPEQNVSQPLEVKKNKGVLFSDAAEAHMIRRLREKAISVKTAKHYRMTYREFVKLVGDKPVEEISRLDIDKYMETITLLPKDWSKSRKYKDMSLEQIVKQSKSEDVVRLSKRTLNRHLRALSGLFKALRNQDKLKSEAPTEGYEVSSGAPKPKERLPWPETKLKELFCSPIWTGAKSEKRLNKRGELLIGGATYWLPILGIYHGNRLEEFAQLQLEDLKIEDGINYFFIHDEGDRRIKNKQSKRKIPIHPTVLELGFLDYCKKTASDPNDKLFPELTPDKLEGKYGTNYSKQFNYYRNMCGIYDEDFTYHSFRHNVTTKLFECDVSDHLIDELTGHEGGSISRRVYKHQMPIKQLFDAISKVRWPEVEDVLFRYKRVF